MKKQNTMMSHCTAEHGYDTTQYFDSTVQHCDGTTYLVMLKQTIVIFHEQLS